MAQTAKTNTKTNAAISNNILNALVAMDTSEVLKYVKSKTMAPEKGRMVWAFAIMLLTRDKNASMVNALLSAGYAMPPRKVFPILEGYTVSPAKGIQIKRAVLDIVKETDLTFDCFVMGDFSPIKELLPKPDKNEPMVIDSVWTAVHTTEKSTATIIESLTALEAAKEDEASAMAALEAARAEVLLWRGRYATAVAENERLQSQIVALTADAAAPATDAAAAPATDAAAAPATDAAAAPATDAAAAPDKEVKRPRAKRVVTVS